MRIDWQAFLDGSMDASERAHVEKLLKTDPAAKRELDGLVALRDTVRTAGVSVPVPLERLSAGLKRIAPQPVRRPWRFIAAACLVVGSGLVVRTMVARSIQPTESQQGEAVYAVVYNGLDASESMNEMKRFILVNSGISNHVPLLKSVGTLKIVHCGRGWACYDYKGLGSTVHMYVSRPTESLRNCETRSVEGGEISILESIKATSFDLGGLRYTFSGCGETNCSKVAQLAMAELNQKRA